MSDFGKRPVVWVPDTGQKYAMGMRVQWVREGDHSLLEDPLGPYEVESFAVDGQLAPERWLRVQLRGA